MNNRAGGIHVHFQIRRSGDISLMRVAFVIAACVVFIPALVLLIVLGLLVAIPSAMILMVAATHRARFRSWMQRHAMSSTKRELTALLAGRKTRALDVEERRRIPAPRGDEPD
jgi:ABC-type transport system involved in cytochrome bd biosynthesis fused ATPase/permease subunit